MAHIEVLDGGMLTTVQDLGRVGAQKYGVPVSGAMDDWSLRAANRLVGNPDGAACLEMTLVGPLLRFDGRGVVALTGADLGAALNGRPVAPWQSVAVEAGCELSFAGRRDGLRAYLAAAGGIDVPVVLGSRSTSARSTLGGFEGRPLRAGDRVPIGGIDPRTAGPGRRLPRHIVPSYGHAPTLRVVMGPQDDAFTDEGIRTFLTEAFTLSPQSDRVGCRFLGPRIAHRAGADIVSDGTAFGSVQVPGEGLPIVLMADRGTAGGYTKIATVASADLPLLAQATPGDRVRFAAIGVDEAQALLRMARARLGEIRQPGHEDAAGAIYEEDTGASLAADAYVGLSDALDRRLSAAAVRPAAVCASMPGLVVSVAVAPGGAVAAGQTLLVMEAMKMQNVVRAPRAGRVGRVRVSPGQLVDAGAVLIEFTDV